MTSRRPSPSRLVAALLVVVACVPSSGSDDDATASVVTTRPTGPGHPLPFELVGRYASGAVLLELFADGSYAADVIAMYDGCLTVEGNGSSRGRWEQDGQVLTFRPVTDDSRLRVDFSKAWVAFVGDGLRLQAPGWDGPLEPVAPDSDTHRMFGFFSREG